MKRRPRQKLFVIHPPLLAFGLWLMPYWIEACPLCVDATPYKIGMQWAIVVLLPVPFTLAFFLYRWIRNASPSEGE